MAIRLEAGGPNERVKNDNAPEEKVTTFKVSASDYESKLAEPPKRPKAPVCNSAVDTNEAAGKKANIV